MGSWIGKLVAMIGADTSGLDKGLSDSENKLEGFSKSGAANLLDFGLKAGAAMLAVTQAIRAGKAVFEFGEEAAALDRLSNAGDNLARSMGSNMDVIVAKVREASKGTVADMDIIASASKSMMLGVSADADEMANLMEIAALRGRAMGISTTQAFDDIVRGIGRMSPLILDNLGIIVDADSTYGAYAESIGKAASELSSIEKRQALLNRVLDEGNKMLAQTGGLVDDTASSFERLEANSKNLANNLKMTLAPALSAVVGGLNDFLFGQKENIDNFKLQSSEIMTTTGSYQDYIREMERVAEGMNYVLYRGNLLTEGNRALIESNVIATESQWKAAQVNNELAEKMTLRANAAQFAMERERLLNEQMTASREEALLYSEQLQSQINQGILDIENLRMSMENWKMSAGDQMVNYLGKYIPESSELYREGLGVVDEVTGTAHQQTYDLNVELDKMAKEFANTKDTDAFRSRLREMMDKEMQQFEEKVKNIQTKLDSLYSKLSELAKTWVIDIVVNYRGGSLPGGVGAAVGGGGTTLAGGYDKFQTGGTIFANERALVGERGPEMFRSFRSGWIDSQPYRARDREGEGQTINFYFQDTTLDEVQLRDSIRRVERLSYA